MVEEIWTLRSNGTCDPIVLPLGKVVVGCKWIFIVKVGADSPKGQPYSMEYMLSDTDIWFG
jgi:hypothetical protein